MVGPVLHYLINKRGGLFVDATLGAAGHAVPILEATAPGGRLLGVERDPVALAPARARLQPCGDRVTIVHADFRDLADILNELGTTRISGILFDLGLSSMQLDDPTRGFSYSADGPLDMRTDPGRELTAESIVNDFSEKELAKLFFTLGEERRSRQAATRIVAHRRHTRIISTRQLAELLRPVLTPGPYHRSLARIFMALRIAVNDELTALATGLAAGVSALEIGSRVVVLAYHSLEDRIVKSSFREWSRPCRCGPLSGTCVCRANPVLSILTRRPVRASAGEIAENPRARPAKLRAAEKTAAGQVRPVSRIPRQDGV